MAFLDNSGDIILDAVLTDTGRLRLAQGDGSFKISKFALGDDEINYALYNKNHASGSAYYDLEVLQTPILEAFTNNTSNLKTKLVSISRTNILFMPTLKLNRNMKSTADGSIQGGDSEFYLRQGINTMFGGDTDIGDIKRKSSPRFYVAVDEPTRDLLIRGHSSTTPGPGPANKYVVKGVIEGFVRTGNSVTLPHLIRVDQGLDTSELSPNLGLDQDLLETAYIVEMDYRLGRVRPWNSHTPTAVNFIDDDNIATYYLNTGYVNPAGQGPADVETDNGSKNLTLLEEHSPVVHQGPRGTCLQFGIEASTELNSSTYLFKQIGQSQLARATDNIIGLKDNDPRTTATSMIYYIDSVVRVVGANTGFRLDIPVRYVKVDGVTIS
jgi:hypothetical protein